MGNKFDLRLEAALAPIAEMLKSLGKLIAELVEQFLPLLREDGHRKAFRNFILSRYNKEKDLGKLLSTYVIREIAKAGAIRLGSPKRFSQNKGVRNFSTRARSK